MNPRHDRLTAFKCECQVLVQPLELVHKRSHADYHARSHRTQDLGIGLALEHLWERLVHHIGDAAKLLLTFVCQFSATMGDRRIKCLVTRHKALSGIGQFSGRMSVHENLAEILINGVTDRIPCAVTADMADINRLVAFRGRSQLHVIKTVHEIFTAGSVRIGHHLGVRVILTHDILHPVFSLNSRPLLRSRRNLGE